MPLPARPIRWISYRPLPWPGRARRLLNEALAAENPHVVHIHTPFVVGQLAMERARQLGIPVVCTLHLQPDNVSSYSVTARLASKTAVRAVDLAYARIMRHSALVSAPTDFAARYAGRLAGRDDIATISNGVPLPSQVTVHGERPLPVALYVGRLSAEKRLDVLLEAAQIVQRDTDFALRIVGYGNDAGDIVRYAQTLKLRNCEFTGVVSDAALEEIYRNADIFCMPSPIELECVAMLEAMAHALPVVGPDAGAVREVTKGTGGAVVYDESSGPRGAAEALSILLSDGKLRKSMGVNARATIAERDIRVIAKRWTAMYSDIIEKKAPSFPWVETRAYRTSSQGLIMSHWTDHVAGKQTLVLLHGIAIDAVTCWSGVAPLLSREYNIVAFDLYGHGSTSPVGAEDGLLIDFAVGLQEAIEHYNLNGCTIIGHSLGGVVAQLLLRQAPRGVAAGLVLSSTASRFSTTFPDKAYFLWIAAAASFVRILPRPLQALVGVVSAHVQGIGRYPRFEASRMDWPQVLGSGVLLARFDSRKWIATISTPIGQIITRNDRVVSFDKQMELNALLGDAETRITNLPHDASVTDPARYADTLRSLLSAL
jgi:glycosyltransferase involved in cell wall biosynthesis